MAALRWRVKQGVRKRCFIVQKFHSLVVDMCWHGNQVLYQYLFLVSIRKSVGVVSIWWPYHDHSCWCTSRWYNRGVMLIMLWWSYCVVVVELHYSDIIIALKRKNFGGDNAFVKKSLVMSSVRTCFRKISPASMFCLIQRYLACICFDREPDNVSSGFSMIWIAEVLSCSSCVAGSVDDRWSAIMRRRKSTSFVASTALTISLSQLLNVTRLCPLDTQLSGPPFK